MDLGRKKKRLLIWIIVITGVITISLILLTFLAPKFIIDYIEDNDISLMKRQVTIQDLSFNPINFTFQITDLKIKDANNISTFISCDELTVNFEALPFFKSKIDIKEFTANNLYVHLVQNGKRFNFSDLFEEDKNQVTENESKPFEFDLKNLKVLNSRIDYTDAQIGSKLSFNSIEIRDNRFTSSDSIFDAEVAINQKEGGSVNGNFALNIENNDYQVAAKIKAWELGMFKGYAASVIKLSQFGGKLEADLKISVNTTSDFIKTVGDMSILDLKLVDPENKPLVDIGKFFVDVTEIDSQNNIYDFKEITIKNSFINFEYLPNGDNFSKCLVVSNDDTSEEKHKKTDYYVSPFEMLSVYIYDMTKEYIFKSYTAEIIQLSNFNLKFYDYTIEDPFFMDLSEVKIKSENIKPENQFSKFDVHGKMNKTGIVDGTVSVSRTGVENMAIYMSVKGLFLNRFSPYGHYYTAHRFLEGIASFTNKSEIKNSYLTSTNKLFVEKIKVSKKDKTKAGSSLPMRLVVGLIKDKDGNIDLEIPVEGPVSDPKYKFKKVIWKVVKNLFTKIASSPFNAVSNLVSINEDDLKNIYFENGQVGLAPKQKKTLDAITIILNKKEDIIIKFNHLYNKEYEMDAIALKIIKLNYLKQSGLPIDAKIPIGKQAFDISTNDVAFLDYLKTTSTIYDNTISIPENARKLLGQEFLEKELIRIQSLQKQKIKEYLINEKGVLENRFKIKDVSNTEEALNQSMPKFEVKFGVEE